MKNLVVYQCVLCLLALFFAFVIRCKSSSAAMCMGGAGSDSPNFSFSHFANNIYGEFYEV